MALKTRLSSLKPYFKCKYDRPPFARFNGLLNAVIFPFQLHNMNPMISPLARIEPPFWWTGMNEQHLQLIVYGNQIASTDVEITNPLIKLVKVNRVENTNYLFLDLQITAEVQPGYFSIFFKQEQEQVLRYEYELKAQAQLTSRIQGVSSKDFIYLLMPDRFANGDISNDEMEGMRETGINRESIFHRHGGDLQGVIDHLDYLKDLGVTAIWCTPEIENDQPEASYHGYAVTDHYKIDPRLGTNALYKNFVDKCHEKGLKVIKDLVHNHIGDRHWFFLDMPMNDWVNQWPEFTRTTHKEPTVMDPYASKADLRLMQNGWFDHHMPDLNHKNPFLCNYLIQNHIWWVAYAGIDGIRLDTYPYSDPEFMAQWALRLKAEFPNLSIFGETVVSTIPAQVFFTQGDTVNRGFDTHLPGVTDAVLRSVIYEALNGNFGWNDGVNRLYSALSLDFLYQDVTRNVVFLDNHDTSRFFSMVEENLPKFKSGIAILLTTRGIPQLYYGTEILMKNFADPDGMVRFDFPGGWPEDSVNKFTAEGRTEIENEAFNYIRKLANYRKNNEVLQIGSVMQYVPVDNVYVYFRYNEEKTVMIVTNADNEEKMLVTERFIERISGFTIALDVITGQEMEDISCLIIPPKTTQIYELLIATE
ncbi:MAG: glycoside hydrolase family 13 protein [Sphingobacteriaceae bacterium]